MDNFIENVSGYSMWDIRNALEKVTAKVMNYTEMEQKVREATSNEPWGASGTLKQELAQATHNFQYFNEIMPAIFKRFTENEPKQWRQIYKTLVLLEYLVTHGSERVVDEARGHISTVKVLRNFQYVDDNGKDEGINVRNRAKEFAEMLGSVDRIKEERKKAKANRNKYVGSEGGGFAGTGSKYGGFGSDSYYEGGSGGGYNGSGSGSGSSYRGNGRYDDRGSSSRSNRYDDEDPEPSNSPPARRSARKTESTKSAPKAEPVKEVNLFDFDEPVAPAAPVAQGAFGGSAPKPLDDGWGALQSGNDDFDDFQSAPPVEQKAAASIPALPAYNATMASVLPPARANSTSSNSGAFGAKAGNGGGAFDLLGSSPANGNATFGSAIPAMSAPSSKPTSSFPSQNTTAPASNPNDIWANASGLISLDGLGKAKAKEAAPSMNALAANSWNSGAWAASKPATPAGSNQAGFGNFGNAAPNSQTGNKNSNNFNDLLF
ncbi:Epsin-3, clathrin recruitment and traffic between the Golgi and endosome [Mortierella alpina]|uniref:Epsin-3, clathrin recruitment and traffic between the Golgi and endosome n=1 Tax=Mortierella alpina TaxID=64518 RepID=A0A9P6ITA3_MORAP|nr:Epsin-3, clathrin recruitment and traffic between the Golgi and endosome [Mortierella alpina]